MIASSIALCALILLVALIRRATSRPSGSVDLTKITVSRQWLLQHQSNDR